MLANMLYLIALAAASTIAAAPDAARTAQNTPVTTPVLANDTGGLDPGSVTIVTPSADGTARANQNGSVTFTPAPGFTGTTTYSYRVCDTSTPPACATAVVTVTVTAPSGGGEIRISIKNEYDAQLDFGALGRSSRQGTDRAEGVLQFQGGQYVGIVTASVNSSQTIVGLIARRDGSTGSCGPAMYQDSQQLRVTAHVEDGFNPEVQSVYPGTMTGQPSPMFLRLEFAPETMTSQQPGPRLPPSGPQDPFLEDLMISCHTLIDTESGIAFLPLNDSRWTMPGGGYIIQLPSSGTIRYTDSTVPPGAVAAIGPFKANKSVWTIEVERL